MREKTYLVPVSTESNAFSANDLEIETVNNNDNSIVTTTSIEDMGINAIGYILSSFLPFLTGQNSQPFCPPQEASKRSGIPLSRIRADIMKGNLPYIHGCNSQILEYDKVVAYYSSIAYAKEA